MGNRYIFSDGHLGHDGIYRFRDSEGHLLRPWANSAAEADELMIDAWNRTVNPKDTVYHLGDVAISHKSLPLLARMNGRKILIKGNHDIYKLKQYLPYFADIRSEHLLERCILSHRPIHPDTIPDWCWGNIHGHTHANHMMRQGSDGTPERDPRYLNVCVEVMGCAPVSAETVIDMLRKQREAAPA